MLEWKLCYMLKISLFSVWNESFRSVKVDDIKNRTLTETLFEWTTAIELYIKQK